MLEAMLKSINTSPKLDIAKEQLNIKKLINDIKLKELDLSELKEELIKETSRYYKDLENISMEETLRLDMFFIEEIKGQLGLDLINERQIELDSNPFKEPYKA